MRRLLVWAMAASLALASVWRPAGTEASHLCGRTGSPAGPFDFETYEAADWPWLYLRVMELAGENRLFPDIPEFALPALETGPRAAGSARTVAPYIPPVILKAIGWIESHLWQADYSVNYGQVGPVLVSHDCGYGIMQVTTGMQNETGVPTLRQAMIGGHFAFNIAEGARILATKWNLAPEALPVVGERDPHIVEDWYYAIWAYNGFAYVNHPNNPAYDRLRSPYRCDGSQSRTEYPYQELVLGCIRHPPEWGGKPLWQAVPVSLPDYSSPAFSEKAWQACSTKGECQAMDIPTPGAPRAMAQAEGVVSREAVIGMPKMALDRTAVRLTASGPGTLQVPFALENGGTGVLAWLVTWDASWLKVTRQQDGQCTPEVRYQGVALGNDLGSRPSRLCLVVDPQGLGVGTYRGSIVFQTMYAVNRVATLTVELTVASAPVSDGQPRWFFPFISEEQKLFGMPGDIPVPADYDGDGRDEMAVFRPSEGLWIIYGRPPVRFGIPGDIPVPADYNGDGRADIAVFRPFPSDWPEGTWFIPGLANVKFGIPGDIPVPADYNGDGRADIAVFRPFPSDWPEGTWFIPGLANVKWGIKGDIPVPADYFGQGKAIIGVFRPR